MQSTVCGFHAPCFLLDAKNILKKVNFTLDYCVSLCYNPCCWYLGVAQVVERYLGVVEAAGSSPVTQIKNPLGLSS